MLRVTHMEVAGQLGGVGCLFQHWIITLDYLSDPKAMPFKCGSSVIHSLVTISPGHFRLVPPYHPSALWVPPVLPFTVRQSSHDLALNVSVIFILLGDFLHPWPLLTSSSLVPQLEPLTPTLCKSQNDMQCQVRTSEPSSFLQWRHFPFVFKVSL